MKVAAPYLILKVAAPYLIIKVAAPYLILKLAAPYLIFSGRLKAGKVNQYTNWNFFRSPYMRTENLQSRDGSLQNSPETISLHIASPILV